MKNEKEHFLEIAYNSNKWKKWMIKDSKMGNASFVALLILMLAKSV